MNVCHTTLLADGFADFLQIDIGGHRIHCHVNGVSQQTPHSPQDNRRDNETHDRVHLNAPGAGDAAGAGRFAGFSGRVRSTSRRELPDHRAACSKRQKIRKF